MEEIIYSNLNNYVPIIRLINNNTKEVYSICIKYQLEDNLSQKLICKTFDLYFIIIIKKENDNEMIKINDNEMIKINDNEMIKMNKKIDKNIDPNNIIEILFENTIDSGIIIFNS